MPLALVIYLLPLGDDILKEDVVAVESALRAFFPQQTVVMPAEPLPKSAYYEPRKRYRAEKLLDFLRGKKPRNGLRIIGLTARDISTTKDAVYDWGILGLGDLDGVASVISTFRCKIKARSPAHMRERLAKVAVHEVGHTLGLDHCTTRGCLMHDAEGLVATVDGEYDFCERCRATLKVPPANVPWKKPPGLD